MGVVLKENKLIKIKEPKTSYFDLHKNVTTISSIILILS